MKLKEIVRVKRGLVARGEEKGEVRYLRLADFDEKGQMQPGNERYITEQPDEKYVLKSGDILMSIMAPRFFAMKFSEEEGTFVPNHFFNILNLKTDRLSADKLVEILNSDNVQKQLDGLTEGENIRTIPTKNLEDLKVRL